MASSMRQALQSRVVHLIFIWIVLSGCMAFISGCGWHRSEILGEVGIMLVTMAALFAYQYGVKSLRLELASQKARYDVSGKVVAASSRKDEVGEPVHMQVRPGVGETAANAPESLAATAVPKLETELAHTVEGSSDSTSARSDSPASVPCHANEDPPALSLTCTALKCEQDYASTFAGKMAWADIDSDDENAFPEWKCIGTKTAVQSEPEFSDECLEPDELTMPSAQAEPDDSGMIASAELPLSHETRVKSDPVESDVIQYDPCSTLPSRNDAPLQTTAAPFCPGAQPQPTVEQPYAATMMHFDFDHHALMGQAFPNPYQSMGPSQMFGEPLAPQEPQGSPLCPSYANLPWDYAQIGWGTCHAPCDQNFGPSMVQYLNVPSNATWNALPHSVAFEPNLNQNMPFNKPDRRAPTAADLMVNDANVKSSKVDDFSDSEDEEDQKQVCQPLAVSRSSLPILLPKTLRSGGDWEATRREVRCLNALDLQSPVTCR